jgi:hypothetical protein
MQKRSSGSRALFFVVLTAIAVVYLVGRLWLERGERPAAMEAGIVPALSSESPPAK